MESEPKLILRRIDLMRLELANLSMSGPRFVILHRFWKPETVCLPGEAIADVQLLQRTRQIALSLSLRLMLLFDYMARHKFLAQSAAQIAAGMTADFFYKRHGANAQARADLSRRVSRRAVKQQVMRLRAALRAAFRKAGLNLDPRRVVVSEKTTTNEVRYRLRASVIWEHLES